MTKIPPGSCGRTVASCVWATSLLSMACFVLAGFAVAASGDDPPLPGPAELGKQPPKTDAAAPAADDTGCGPKGSRDVGASAQKPAPATQGLSLKWVCNANGITLKPIWSGKPIDATWVIRNEGEGNLSLKIKGG